MQVRFTQTKQTSTTSISPLYVLANYIPYAIVSILSFERRKSLKMNTFLHFSSTNVIFNTFKVNNICDKDQIPHRDPPKKKNLNGLVSGTLVINPNSCQQHSVKEHEHRIMRDY